MATAVGSEPTVTLAPYRRRAREVVDDHELLVLAQHDVRALAAAVDGHLPRLTARAHVELGGAGQRRLPVCVVDMKHADGAHVAVHRDDRRLVRRERDRRAARREGRGLGAIRRASAAPALTAHAGGGCRGGGRRRGRPAHAAVAAARAAAGGGRGARRAGRGRGLRLRVPAARREPRARRAEQGDRPRSPEALAFRRPAARPEVRSCHVSLLARSQDRAHGWAKISKNEGST
jgi:hypothetical protein